MPAVRPLSEGNRLQRAYARWAEPWYQRMPEGKRDEARRTDAWLYSRSGLKFWAGVACAVVGTAAGLRGAGMHLALALLVAVLVWSVLGIAALGAWIAPERFTARRMLRGGAMMLLISLVQLLAGFAAGRIARPGGLQLETLPEALVGLFRTSVPGILGLGLAMMALIWIVASSRRWQMQIELAQVRLERERDQAARAAAEARLRLLQGQIQPHFIFNTLAAAQHWVDSGDARAGELLRTLSAFLRASIDSLGRAELTLGEEAERARSYLQIMRSRLGERLRFELDVPPGLLTQPLPPGLLLTLVENAVEHGIEPSLAGGEVRVRAGAEDGRTWIEVSDSGVGLAGGWAEGVGLANTRERLAQLHGEAARASLLPREAGGAIARVEWPTPSTFRATPQPEGSNDPRHRPDR